MVKRIGAISFIFLCTAIAWAILGFSIFSRTYNLQPSLANKVASSWGTPQEQTPPFAWYIRTTTHKTKTTVDGKTVEKDEEENIAIPLLLESSNVEVALDLQHRQKGLLWYSTYTTGFTGVYRFRNPTGKAQQVYVSWRFPAEKAI